MSKPSMRWGAAVAAGMFGVISVFGLATSASAQPAPGPGNIDPDAIGSLTMHKYTQPLNLSDDPLEGPSGLETTVSADATPIEGIEFTVQPVNEIAGNSIDLTEASDWALIQSYLQNPDTFDPASSGLGTALTGSTDAAGEFVFEDLPVGLYYVTESGYGGNNVVYPMRPFLVTIPTQGATEGSWNYDVHAYPKNSLSEATKEVSYDQSSGDATLAVGDEVHWALTQQIPNFPTGQALESVGFIDTLPAEVTYASSTATVSGTGVVLTPVDDYTLDQDANVVTMQLTAAGVAKAALGTSVVWDVFTTVNSIGDGALENNAIAVLNGVNSDITATANFGGLRIFKYADNAGTQVALSGAEFQIYATEADAAAGTNPIDVAGTSTFVSDVNGNILVSGLVANNAGGNTYFVKETKAPAGYALSTAVIEVIVTPGSDADAAVYSVLNVQQPAGWLPETGSSASIILWSIGGLLLLGGAALLINERRKADAKKA